MHTARWLARDLVIWRAEDGTPHVMDAYCPHMRWAAQFYVDGDPLAADRAADADRIKGARHDAAGFSARSRSPGDRKRAEKPTEEEQYRIADDEDTAAREHERLRVLGRWRDPATIAALEATGIAPGWRCLEVGAGAGTISAWMAERVGPGGAVLSTDVDLRFHGEPSPPTKVVQHDITRDPLAEASFDLVHARAVLQHVAERELALERTIAALKPGGWILVEEADTCAFEAQPPTSIQVSGRKP